MIATTDGEPTIAIELLTTSLIRAVDSSDRRGVAMAVEALAHARAVLGDPLLAAGIVGAADALRAEIGGAPPMSQRGGVDRAETVARSQLDPDVYDIEYGRGYADPGSVVARLTSGEPA
jgi:hypothetical protein